MPARQRGSRVRWDAGEVERLETWRKAQTGFPSKDAIAEQVEAWRESSQLKVALTEDKVRGKLLAQAKKAALPVLKTLLREEPHLTLAACDGQKKKDLAQQLKCTHSQLSGLFKAAKPRREAPAPAATQGTAAQAAATQPAAT